MKSLIVFLALTLSAPQITQAQGTVTYLSNLDQPSAGSRAVGSDSWLAMTFRTGTNSAGYSFDSIQMRMADALGNPSGFTAMIYDAAPVVGGSPPGKILGTLNGSLEPVGSGIYTYSPASSLTLSPHTPYHIVLTAGTPVADGAYEWSLADGNSYNPRDGWAGLAYVWTSSDGSQWQATGDYPQLAISGAPVPEPSALALLALGGLLLVWHHRKSLPG